MVLAFPSQLGVEWRILPSFSSIFISLSKKFFLDLLACSMFTDTSSTTSRLLCFLKERCLPYMLIWRHFFMQMSVAVHEHISLERVGFISGHCLKCAYERVINETHGVFTPLVQFVWACENTAIGCGLNQSKTVSVQVVSQWTVAPVWLHWESVN